MAEFPYMQLWVAELMSDRKVLAMTNEEFGMYMRLLCVQWLDGPIPMSDAIAISSVPELPERVLSCFSMREHGKLVNLRLEKEWKKLQDIKKSKSAKAKSAAKSRWEKELVSNANALPKQCKRNANAMLGDAISYSYSENKKNIQKEKPPGVCVPDSEIGNDNFLPDHMTAQEGALSENRIALEKAWITAKSECGFQGLLDRGEKNHIPALCQFVDSGKIPLVEVIAAMCEFWKRKKTDKGLDKWGLQAFVNNLSKFVPMKSSVTQQPGQTITRKFYELSCPHCKTSAASTTKPPKKVKCGVCGKEFVTETS